MGFQVRSPLLKSLEFLGELNKQGKLTKWDLIKISGNEAQFNRWVTGYLLRYKFIEEVKEGRVTFYKKTADGELFHTTLRNWRIVTAYSRIVGKKLKRE